MAQKDQGTEEPNLELPSLFGRRKKQRKDEALGGTEPAAVEPDPEPEPAGEAVAEPEPTVVPEPESTRAMAPVEAPPTRAPAVPAPTSPRPMRGGSRAATTPGKRAAARGARVEKAPRSAPNLGASTAALVVGAVTGLAGCVLTYLGLQGCELVTSTSSCGGPGLLILAVIGVAMVLAGAAMLRFFAAPEPGNVSFLGVGIMVVVVLLFLIDSLYEPWMFIAVPAVTAASFAVARWVTTRYADDVWDDPDASEPHDIR